MPEKKRKGNPYLGVGTLVPFSIRLKLFVFLGFVGAVLFLTSIFGLYGLDRITNSSREITEREVPLSTAIQGALLAILEGTFALDEALEVEDFFRLDSIRIQEAKLNNSAIRFDAYLAAITWGSESEAFRKSSGGLNFAEWKRLGLEGTLLVQRPAPQEVQLAGATDIYFGGFVNNALRAIANHKKFLRLQMEGKGEEARTTKAVSQEHASRALNFLGLAIGSLSKIVDISNTSIRESAQIIETTQREITRNTFVVFVIGLPLFLYIGFILTSRSIIKPLQSLTAVAQKISTGDFRSRAEITTRDEMGILARAFNRMADRLAEYPMRLERRVRERTKELQKANRQLKGRTQELAQIAKTLVRRDFELADLRKNQEDRLKELDQTAKTLVRRDMELLRANDELRELDEAKSHFVSIAAHQLRTPLSVIKWTLRMLLSGDFGPVNTEQKEAIKRGYRTNEDMIKLVSDLLDVARVESGRFSYNFQDIVAEKLVEEVVNKYTSTAEERRISIKIVKPARAKPIVVRGDRRSLSMVLQNLVSNAINYTLPGGRIEIEYKKEDDFLIIAVRDTGVGVPAHQKSRLFTKFFRGDNVVRMQTKGTGLGLYISANIIRSHRGKIEVESEEGKGSTFLIKLPIKK